MPRNKPTLQYRHVFVFREVVGEAMIHIRTCQAKEGLRDFRAQMYWRSGRVRGGEGLLCLTSTPACFRRSIVVESLLQGAAVSLNLKPYVSSPICIYNFLLDFFVCQLCLSVCILKPNPVNPRPSPFPEPAKSTSNQNLTPNPEP